MTTIQVRVDDSIKASAENAFRAMGFSMTDGIRSYLNYVSMERKLPFEPRANPWHAHEKSAHIPNAETEAALRNAMNGENLSPTNLDDLRAMWTAE